MRKMSTLRKAAPLPSPIPTAAGSRSAANEIFTEFLDNSLQLPHLSLPHHLHRLPIPEIVDFGSLTGRDSVDRILRSAKECGAFRINGHGISGEELRSLLREADAESVFRISEGNLNFGNREGIVWDRSNIERLDSAGKFIGTERYRNFSQNMENLASKLDNVAKQLIEIFIESAGKRFQGGINEKETVLTLYRYDHNDLLMEKNQSLPNEKNGNSCGHALSLHLPIEHSQFHVKSKHGSLSFEEGPDTIVVTVGKQLEEWTLGEFECVSGEMIIVPDCQGSRPSYSVELKYSPSSINHSTDKDFCTLTVLLLMHGSVLLIYCVYSYSFCMGPLDAQFVLHGLEGCGFEL